ncbi:MAG: tetratricopeptide repeat protein [Chloroflexia bacterium]|nr:tetratricopeptide repeat protein [Chloroflexia bacterium]
MPDLYHSLAPYIPPPLRRRILVDAACPTEPRSERFAAAVLFADISGFTPLTEALARRGAEGPEEITRLLNRYFSRMIHLAEAEGGEVVEFGGDSVTVLFIAEQEPLSHAVRRALQAAEAMQAAMGDFAQVETSAGPVALGLKIGLGAGEVLTMQLGGVRERWEYAVAGAPGRQAAESESRAQRGEILLSPEAQKLLHPRPLPPRPLQQLDWEALRRTLPDPAAIEETMRCHVPGAIRGWLESGLQEWLGVLRPMSVIFASLAGLNDQQADFVEHLHSLLRMVQRTLYRYEGTLARLAVDDKGTTIMALLGAPPLAHEDDPTRALRCAQDLIDQLHEHAAEVGLGGLSIGVTTGHVFAGPVGGESRREYTVMGDAVNLAARLMVAAAQLPPREDGRGQLLCDFGTYRQARNQVALELLPPIRVKGKAGLVRVYRPAATADPHQPAAISGSPATPLVGRAAERAQLEAALDALDAGRGQVLLITGEAGIGKSRLVGELIHLARERGLSGLLGAGQSVEQQTPYRAWRDILASYFDLEQIGDPSQRREHVGQWAQELIPDQLARLPLLNDVLHLGYPDSELTAALDPALRQQSLQLLLLRLLRAWAGERPLILILEDAQWLDSLSWDLAAYAGRVLATSGEPYLLVLATRPPGPTSLAARALESLRDLVDLETIALTTLDPEETLALVEGHLGLPPGGLPDRAADFVQDRAGGNPFFAEQLALTLQEQELLQIESDPRTGSRRCRLCGDLDAAGQNLPDTIQGLVLARIDRLPPERQLTLKVAAVIGRSFAYTPLRYTMDRHAQLPETSLRGILDELAEHNLTEMEALEPDLSYLFKHIITRDVAYETLLFAQRRELHRTVAAWYEGQAARPEDKDTPYLPLLAYHYHYAQDRDKERLYARLAGEQAAARFANTEAVRYFSRALELTPAEALRDRYELLLRRERLYDLQGSRPAQLADLTALEELARSLGPLEEAESFMRQASYAEAISEHDRAITMAKRAIETAAAVVEARPDPERAQGGRIQVSGYLMWGRILWQLNQFDDSRTRLRQGLQQLQEMRSVHGADEALDREFAQLEGRLWRNLGITYHLQNEFPTGLEHYQRALRIARQVGDRRSEANALNNLGVLSDYMGDYEQGQAYFERALHIAQEIGDRWTACGALENLGISYDNKSDYARSRDAYERAQQIYQEIGDRQGLGTTWNNLAVVLLHLGLFDLAQANFEQSRQIAQAIGDLAVEGLATTGLALLALQLGKPAQARELAESGLELSVQAGEHGSRAYALTSLAQILARQGQLQQSVRTYRRAIRVRLEVDQPHLAVEPQAGLAEALEAQGERAAALEQVGQILHFLQENELTGAQEPLQIYLSCYRVLAAAGDPRAEPLLEEAYLLLQEHAGRIPAGPDRESFLQNVAANREIIQTRGKG